MRALPLHPGARGLEDDCAVLKIGGETLIITQDAMADGTHFLPGADPFDTAWKLVTTNLSDLAAKGAEPMGVLLSYSLGNNDERFIEGLRAVLEEYETPLLGGDTIGNKGPQTLSLTAIGRATCAPVPDRSGAQIGDNIYVCGFIGDAMIGFTELTHDERARDLGLEPDPDHVPNPYFTEKFLRPRPLIDEGQSIAPIVHAAMDVSDGLFLDASRMASASAVTFHIASDDVPYSDAFLARARDGNLLDQKSDGWPMRMQAGAWGDDYALLFTAHPQTELPLACAKIGKVVQQESTPLLVDGQPLNDVQLGYQHG